jgi:hypothetical protein
MGIYSLLITYYSLLQNHRAYPSPDGDAARTGTPRANTAVRMSSNGFIVTIACN